MSCVWKTVLTSGIGIHKRSHKVLVCVFKTESVKCGSWNQVIVIKQDWMFRRKKFGNPVWDPLKCGEFQTNVQSEPTHLKTHWGF